MRVAFITLGCKINQYETDRMRREIEASGNAIVPFDAKADVYIVNTCSVTAKSDIQCRQLIRAAVRRGQGAKIIVTGCYAATNPDEIKRIQGVDLVVHNQDKLFIPGMLASSAVPSAGDRQSDNASTEKSVRCRTRGFLKIQDGCDNHCSYCIVPFARGGSRSVAPEEVIAEYDRLVEEGCPEIVLTGIHIGTYGYDLVPNADLTSLIKKLLDRRKGTRVRLSSIEPREITDEIVRLLGKGLCRHLHIPLQSGDDAILASMKRDYTARYFRDLLRKIEAQVPGIALGTDVMVGYPGEGDAEFRNTVTLIEQSPLTHLHVFSYSRRPGTPAADMKNQVPDRIKKERSEVLRNLANEKNFTFRKKQKGIELNVVVENKVDPISGLVTGLTDNYIRTHILGAKAAHFGKEIRININEVKIDENFADIL